MLFDETKQNYDYWFSRSYFHCVWALTVISYKQKNKTTITVHKMKLNQVYTPLFDGLQLNKCLALIEWWNKFKIAEMIHEFFVHHLCLFWTFHIYTYSLRYWLTIPSNRQLQFHLHHLSNPLNRLIIQIIHWSQVCTKKNIFFFLLISNWKRKYWKVVNGKKAA